MQTPNCLPRRENRYFIEDLDVKTQTPNSSPRKRNSFLIEDLKRLPTDDRQTVFLSKSYEKVKKEDATSKQFNYLLRSLVLLFMFFFFRFKYRLQPLSKETQLSLSNIGTDSSINKSKTTENKDSFVSSDLYNNGVGRNKYKKLNLVAGELPGYTGWPRPLQTFAPLFRLDHYDTHVTHKVEVGNEWNFTLRCSEKQCSQGGALFYLRAYGPSVITGDVVDNLDGSYLMSFYPEDPGTYFVEVVLTFSKTPALNIFPPENKYGGPNSREPLYEGYLVPDFPLQIHVIPPTHISTNKADMKICTIDQMAETNINSALRKGRWVITESVRNKFYSHSTKELNEVSMIGYETGFNSIGIFMKYKYNDCELLTRAEIVKGHDKLHLMDQCLQDKGIYNSERKKDSYQLLFIGDSVMRGEYTYMRQIMSTATNTNIKIQYISTIKGLYFCLETIRAELEKLRLTKPKQKRIILFNSGLHDADRMCSKEMSGSRKEMGIETDSFVCLDEYRKLLKKLVDYIGQYPADLKVFRSTTAGWMRYGNFGFAWKPLRNQGFVRSPNFVAKINEIAYDVIKTSGFQIDIIDGYWMTLPRPDNTEVSKENIAGKHMVHPGVEVYTTMCRKWFTFIMQYMCNNLLEG